MKRVRAGAYIERDYLIRYAAWLDENWDGPRESYCPWHVYRRASRISSRMLLERFRDLEQAKRYVGEQIREDDKLRVEPPGRGR